MDQKDLAYIYYSAKTMKRVSHLLELLGPSTISSDVVAANPRLDAGFSFAICEHVKLGKYIGMHRVCLTSVPISSGTQ